MSNTLIVLTSLTVAVECATNMSDGPVLWTSYEGNHRNGQKLKQ